MDFGDNNYGGSSSPPVAQISILDIKIRKDEL